MSLSINAKYEQHREGIACLGGNHVECLPHLHREIEIICLYEGEVVAFADTKRCTMRAGDLFISFPDQIHSYEIVKPERHIGFLVKPTFIPEIGERFTAELPISPIIPGCFARPDVRFLCEELHRGVMEEGSSPYVTAQRKGYLLALCAILLENLKLTRPVTGDSAALRAIVAYCSKNHGEDISLSTLEENLHLNKYYISHLFSQKLKLKFNDYVNSLRVTDACKYLLNSHHSVTDIGSMVGFNTSRTFNRAFMKQLGVSPKEYRKNGIDMV